MSSESGIEKKVVAGAAKLGIYTRKFTSPGNASVPDRIFIWRGAGVLFLEFKRRGERPTPAQQDELDILRLGYGVPATWVDTVVDAMKLLVLLRTRKTNDLLQLTLARNNWQANPREKKSRGDKRRVMCCGAAWDSKILKHCLICTKELKQPE